MLLARESSSSRLRLVRHRSGLFFFEPTIFFFCSTNGGLEEALDVVIRSDGTAADGAKITVNGKRSLSSSIRTRHGASKSSASMSPTLSDRRTLQPN
jgi:hypothetical protein